MTDLRKLTRIVVTNLDQNGNEHNAARIVEPLRGALAASGLAPGCHVGRTEWTPEQRVEWYAGQVVYTVDERAWFAINSIVNCLDKFCPEVPA